MESVKKKVRRLPDAEEENTHLMSSLSLLSPSSTSLSAKIREISREGAWESPPSDWRLTRLSWRTLRLVGGLLAVEEEEEGVGE